MKIHIKTHDHDIISCTYGREFLPGADLADGGWIGPDWAFTIFEGSLEALEITTQEHGITELGFWDSIEDLDPETEQDFTFDTETKKLKELT